MIKTAAAINAAAVRSSYMGSKHRGNVAFYGLERIRNNFCLLWTYLPFDYDRVLEDWC